MLLRSSSQHRSSACFADEAGSSVSYGPHDMSNVDGHAFICYVREDSQHADALSRLLTENGIPVWRDTEDLWPGEDWRARIREAITEGAFAFIPIFTSTSVAKGVSGQAEELYLAAEEMRRRLPGVTWLVPVRFDECTLPKLDLGGGRVLDDIQRADLFGPNANQQAERLVEAVRRIIDADPPAPAPVAGSGNASEPIDQTRLEEEVKKALRDPDADIRLWDMVIPVADAVYSGLIDADRYPVNGTPSVSDIITQVDQYWTDIDGLLDLLVTAGLWSRPEHERTWAELVRRVARSCTEQRSGNVARLGIRWFPLLPLVYAGGLAAVTRQNYGFIRATALDAQVRDLQYQFPVVAKAHPWQPFGNWALPAHVIALQASGETVDDQVLADLESGRRGKRYTPVSDHLHDRLRERFRRHIPDDEDYSSAFDRLEVLLGLLNVDLHLQAKPSDSAPWTGPYFSGGFTGRFMWRERHADTDQRIERRMYAELERHSAQWEPVVAGLFGADPQRAGAAFREYFELADERRSNRW